MNKGIKLATGKIIGILNADDWYEVNALEMIINAYNKSHPNFFYGKSFRYNESGKKYAVSKPLTEFNHSNNYKMPFDHQTFFVTLETYKKIGLFNEKYKLSADHDLIWKVINSKAIGIEIEEPFVNFAEGGRSDSLRSPIETLNSAIENKGGKLISYGMCAYEISKYFCRRILPAKLLNFIRRNKRSRFQWI